MIIAGAYHGIRLYEREVQTHDLVGINIAKLNHFASAISSDGQELMKPFKFANDGDGYQLLHSRLTELSYEDDSIIGLESTVHYADNLDRYLVASNYNVCVEPHQDLLVPVDFSQVCSIISIPVHLP